MNQYDPLGLALDSILQGAPLAPGISVSEAPKGSLGGLIGKTTGGTDVSIDVGLLEDTYPGISPGALVDVLVIILEHELDHTAPYSPYSLYNGGYGRNNCVHLAMGADDLAKLNLLMCDCHPSFQCDILKAICKAWSKKYNSERKQLKNAMQCNGALGAPAPPCGCPS